MLKNEMESYVATWRVKMHVGKDVKDFWREMEQITKSIRDPQDT